MGKIVYAVDEFGEKHEGGIYITPEQAKQDEELKEKRRQYFRRMEEQNTLQIGFEDIFGEFYFVNYRRLLTVINDNTALAFRYLYLCTFADENGKIVFKGKDVIHKSFKRVLNLYPKTANADVAELEKYGLIYSINNIYYVNLEYYVRKQKLPDSFKGNSARVIDKGVRELYEQSTPRQHAMLGKIVPLLEYTNKYTNIICTKNTVRESDHTKIIPLTGYEICRVCGRTTENSDRFLKELRSFSIDRLPFIRRVVDSTKYNLDCYIINPYVVYMGSRNDQLEWTFKLFDLRSRRKR